MSRAIGLALLLTLPALSTAAAADLPAMISVSPAPGITFQIPQDWIACDDDTQKLLHSADDALNVKAKFCSLSSNVPSKMRAFDPRPLHMLSIIFNYHANQPLTEEAMNGIAAEDIDKIRPAICDVETKPLAQNGATMESCDVAMGMLSGHRALVSTLIENTPDSAKYKVVILSYEVAYPQGYTQIQFSHPQMLDAIVKPLLDRIIASIQISSAGSPPPPSGTVPPSSADGAQSGHQDAPPATPPPPDHSI